VRWPQFESRHRLVPFFILTMLMVGVLLSDSIGLRLMWPIKTSNVGGDLGGFSKPCVDSDVSYEYLKETEDA